MRRELLQDSRFRRVISAAALLIGGFGIVYLFRKSIVADWSDVDFIYIWLSGHLWSQGISPYGVEFIEQGSILFDIFNGQAFFYPPSFWFISRIFATFEYKTAVEVWRWTSYYQACYSKPVWEMLALKYRVRQLFFTLAWFRLCRGRF